MFTLAWYDSENPHARTEALELVLSSPDSQRGKLYSCKRDTPADVWPAATLEGRGYSRVSAARIARMRGLVLDAPPVEPPIAGQKRLPV